MKVIMITRKVDREDCRAGFVCPLIRRLSERVNELRVICLEYGRSSLPANVEVVSLGKEKGAGKGRLVFNLQKELAAGAGGADVIFAHMNPVYTILAAPWAGFYKKPLIMWYAHGYVGPQLRLAHRLANRVVTSTPEGCRPGGEKLRVIGQCIDTEHFHPEPRQRPQNRVKLLTVGRISPVKNLEAILKGFYILRRYPEAKNIQLQIVGAPARAKQENYLNKLKKMGRDLGLGETAVFSGPVSYPAVARVCQGAHFFINLSRTGSLDKAILEAMACGCLPVSAAPACVKWFSGRGLDMLTIPQDEPAALAEQLRRLLRLSAEERRALENKVRELVVREHDLEYFTDKLYKAFRYEKDSAGR